MMVTPFLPKTVALPLFAAGIALLVFGTFIYSYILFKKEQKKKLAEPKV